MSAAPQIGPGSRVVLHLALFLTDDTEVLSTFGEDPVTCTLGDGTLQPGLELCLYGMSQGMREEVTLPAGLAYGDPDEDMLQQLEWAGLAHLDPQPGELIAFSLPNGEETAGRVMEIQDGHVLVDFNHPLAGLPLRMLVEVLEVLS
jgi:FKBP-type peptidyl-prolyl cis-trans isomerase SlpA